MDSSVLLAGFDGVAELIIKCCLLPYIAFIFLIGYSPDILKITDIQTILNACHLLCGAQNICNL